VRGEALSGGLALGQSKIGDIGADKGLKAGSIGKVAMHATTGAVYSAATGASAISGAIGGAASELIAGVMESGSGMNSPPSEKPLTTAQIDAHKSAQDSLNSRIKVTSKLTAAAASLVTGGKAKDINTAINVADSAIAHNRRLHPKELEYSKELQKGKTPEEQRRYAAAALSLVEGDKGVGKSDSKLGIIKGLVEQGSGYSKEKNELQSLARSSGDKTAFTYNWSDAASDFTSRNNEIITRSTGGIKAGLGGVGVVASAGLGATAPATGGLSGVLAAASGTASLAYGASGYDQAFGTYTSTEGAKVLQSTSVATGSFAYEKGKELALDAALATGGAAAIKAIGKIGSKVLQTDVVKNAGVSLQKQKTTVPAIVAEGATSKGIASGNSSKGLSGSGGSATLPEGKGFVLSEAATKATPKVTATKKATASSNSPKGARYEAGTASGGKNLAIVREGDKWFRGTEKNAAKIPKQIADQLKGKQFKSFDEFRQNMWKLVAKDSVLSKEFNKGDLNNMKRGLSPEVQSTQYLGKRQVYEIHHRTPINQGGKVYDVDNLVIATPKYHQSILDPKYHVGKK